MQLSGGLQNPAQVLQHLLLLVTRQAAAQNSLPRGRQERGEHLDDLVNRDQFAGHLAVASLEPHRPGDIFARLCLGQRQDMGVNRSLRFLLSLAQMPDVAPHREAEIELSPADPFDRAIRRQTPQMHGGKPQNRAQNAGRNLVGRQLGGSFLVDMTSGFQPAQSLGKQIASRVTRSAGPREGPVTEGPPSLRVGP